MPDAAICKEYILSEEYMDFIANLRRMATIDELLKEEDICQLYLGASYYGIYMAGESGNRRALNEYPYYSIPKCYTLQDAEAMYQAGIIQLQNYPGLELMGDGVMVGFVDTGIDYQNPIFRNLDGSTRIVRIWDQTVQTDLPPEGFLYGSEYSEVRINSALSKEKPEEIVPSVDENGHGTFMASLACGGADVENRFIGAAPESMIAVVKLKEAKQYLRDYYFVDADAACYQETDIMAGIRYLSGLASRKGVPIIICLALGTNMGGHNGGSPLGIYLERVANTSNQIVVLGTGNEADKRHHYLGQITGASDRQEVELRVGNNTRGFTMELWADIPDILEVTIISPSGESVGKASARYGGGIYNFIFEQTRLYVVTRVLVEGTNSELIKMQFERPTAGIWKIVVAPIQYGTGKFHMWLPLEEFLTGDVYFLRSNPEYTITEPGNAGAPITVAYYNGEDNSIAISSGRGYTSEEEKKPDFAAPGVNVTGVNLRGQFTARSGSSIAVGITGGAAALLMEWLSTQTTEGINTIQMKNLMIIGTQRRADLTYPNQEWGYGTLNLYQTLEEIRRY